VFLSDGFDATGAVRFIGAKIGGALDCGGGTFRNADGNALIFDTTAINDDVLLNRQFKANGAVKFFAAKIGEADLTAAARPSTTRVRTRSRRNMRWSEENSNFLLLR
jgi:hypothetical protein